MKIKKIINDVAAIGQHGVASFVGHIYQLPLLLQSKGKMGYNRKVSSFRFVYGVPQLVETGLVDF